MLIKKRTAHIYSFGLGVKTVEEKARGVKCPSSPLAKDGAVCFLVSMPNADKKRKREFIVLDWGAKKEGTNGAGPGPHLGGIPRAAQERARRGPGGERTKKDSAENEKRRSERSRARTASGRHPTGRPGAGQARAGRRAKGKRQRQKRKPEGANRAGPGPHLDGIPRAGQGRARRGPGGGTNGQDGSPPRPKPKPRAARRHPSEGGLPPPTTGGPR